jgi:hypothetical protein
MELLLSNPRWAVIQRQVMSEGGPRPHWLIHDGLWSRRALLAVAVAIPLVGKLVGLPNNSPAAKYLFFSMW